MNAVELVLTALQKATTSPHSDRKMRSPLVPRSSVTRTVAVYITLNALSGCGPSPEEIAKRQAAEAETKQQEERAFCIRAAKLVNKMYPIYRETLDVGALNDALDQSTAENRYTRFQLDTSRAAIEFVISLPADLPATEPGKRWISARCESQN